MLWKVVKMTQPEGPAIDSVVYETLEEIADGDAEFMAELLTQYLDDAKELVAALPPALSADDAEALERAVHTLKSSSANVGAMVLSNLCEELQCIGRSGELGQAVEKVPAAIAEFARVGDELQSRLEKLQGQG